MADVTKKGDLDVRITDAATQVTANVSSENKLLVDSRPAREFGAVSSFGIPKSSPERTIRQYKFSDALLQINFIQSITGTGTISTLSPYIVKVNSGTTASTETVLTTKQPHRQSMGRGIITRAFVQYDNTAVTGNQRCFGLYNDQTGYFIELSGGTLKFVTRKSGVDTIIEAATWDVPITPNANHNLWYIQSEGAGVGNFQIWYNEQLVHTVKNLGVVSTPVNDATDLPLRIENINAANTTDVSINVDGLSVSSEGESAVTISDGIRDILLNSSRRLLVQASGSPLMGEKFDKAIDIVNRWEPILAGAGTYSQPGNDYTLYLDTTTASGDSVELSFRESNLEETTGGFAEFEVGAKFGNNLQAGNVREWGYKDTAGLNGVFFRVNGTTLDFVNLKGGVENVTSLAESLPNLNFHLYKIEHLGAGKISGFIDGNQVVDFSPAAASQVGSAEKRPFLKMYNTAALAASPTSSEFHWIRLLDQSGTRTTIVGIDDNNIFRQVRVNTAGRLLVSQEPPTPPAATTPVKISAKDVMSATVDTFYTITSGKTLTIQRLSAGAQSSNSGHIIELYEDPNGDLSVLNIIDDIYVNGSSSQKDLLGDFIGDGTRRILLRRRAFGGGNNDVTGIWQGYET
jgi:hypothetical protein